MKKKIFSIIMMCCLLFAGCGADSASGSGSGVGSSGGGSALALENPANITLQHPNATKADAMIYQLGSSVVMFESDVNNLVYGYRVFRVPEESVWIRFAQDDYVSCYYAGDVWCSVNLLDEEQIAIYIEGKERVAVDDNVFYIVNNYTTAAYVEAAEGEYIELYSVLDGSSSSSDDYLKDFKKELDKVLERVEIFAATDVNNTEAISLNGKSFDLTQYPVVEDVFTLKFYEVLGFNLYDSKNLLSYASEDFVVRMEDTVVTASTNSLYSGGDGFAVQTDKAKILARTEDGVFTGIAVNTLADNEYFMGFPDLSMLGVTDSEENLKAFINKYFGSVQ